jgi:K+-sensing histidine kinase KdpD
MAPTVEDGDTTRDTESGAKRSRITSTFGAALAPLSFLEIDFDLSDRRQELVKKIRWIIRLRYAVSAGVVILMFFTGWQGLTQQQSLTRVSVLATLITGAVAVTLNVLYFLALRRQKDLKAFVFWQLAVDVVIFSSYVYRSGGVTSPFTFLYLLPIIGAAMLLSARAAASIAGLAVVAYGVIALLPPLGVLAHVSYFVALDSFARKWSYILLMMIITPVAFFTVTALTSFLMKTVREKTESLTRATEVLDHRAHLLEMLYRVSRSAVDAPDSRAVIEQIGQLLVKGLALDRVLLYLVCEDGQSLRLARTFYHPRLDEDELPAAPAVEIPLQEGAGVTARCALSMQPENVTDPEQHDAINRELAKKIGINPFAVAPMAARGELLGVLGIDRKTELGVIGDDEFQLLIAFADQAAAALLAARAEPRRPTISEEGATS